LIAAAVWIAVGLLPGRAQARQAAPSRSCSIYGFVKSALDSTVIPNANVVLVGTKRGAATNSFGFFRIPDLKPGRYIVEVTVVGFRRYLKEVILASGQHYRLEIYLHLEPIILEEIEMKGTREVVAKEIPVSIQELSGLELRTAAPVISQPDVFRTLQMLPGVLSVSDFSSALYVRGGTPDQNLVLLDGAVLYNPFHLGGFFSTFNPSAVSNAELLAGGFPAPYGGRASSVLKVTTSPGRRDRWSGEIDSNFLVTNFFAQGPVPWGSLSLGIRRSYKGYLDVINRQKIFRYSALPYFFRDFQGKLELKPTKNHTISVSGYRDLDLLKNYRQEEQRTQGSRELVDVFDLNVDWGNQAFSFNWYYKLGDFFRSRLLVAESRFHTEMEILDSQMDPYQIRLEDGIRNRSYRGEVIVRPVGFIQLRGGIERQDERFNYDLLGLGRDMIHAVRNPVTTSPYGDITLEYLNVFMVQAGLRKNHFKLPEPSRPDFYTAVFPAYTHELRYFQPGERKQLEPRFGFRFRPNEKIILTGSYGVYNQNLYSLPLQGESSINLLDLWFPLDLKYEPIRATHLIAGFKYYLPEKLTFSVEAYNKHLDNMLERRELFYPWDKESYYYKGYGVMRGFDVLLRRSTRSVYGWIGYSYALAQGHFDGRKFNLRYDRRHSINLAFHWFSWDRDWEVTVNWTYGSGFPYTQIIGRYRIPVINGYPGGEWNINSDYNWKFEKGPKNGANYPAYHRMDFSVRRRFRMGPMEGIVYFQLINVYNHTNTLFLQRSVQRGSNVGNVRRIGMFPTLPSFGLQIRF